MSIEDYEAIWGKRKANNGFKLGTCSNLSLDVQIWELWPMICKERSHLQRIFDTHVEKVIVIQEDLNDLHEEKDELSINIDYRNHKLQFVSLNCTML